MPIVVLIALAVAVLDQLTKALIQGVLEHGAAVEVVPGFFRIVHWSNTGAAWGIFRDSNTLLAVVSVLTVLALYLFRHSLGLDRWCNRLGLGLIGGGIIGNFIDRVRLGYVVDFLDFSIGRYHWPAFNIADSAICIGIGLYLISSWRADRVAKLQADSR